MSAEHRDELHVARAKQASTLEEMRCLDVVPSPRDTRILHTEFVLKRIPDAAGETKSYKAWLVVCGNGQYENDEGTFPPVPTSR